MTHKRAGQSAFTLIELSIVLVIIGLIVGGVLAGQDLIKAASLRAVISEKDKFSAAIYTFRDKYSYLPGDFPNSDTVLGTTNEGGGVNNGDGNGNGILDDYNTSGGSVYQNEKGFFWAQLGAAGLVAGTYPAGYTRAYPGINVPASAFGSGAGYTVANNSNDIFDTSTPIYSQIYNNIFIFGAGESPSNWQDLTNMFPVLTPADSYSIDSKVDDGLPGTGNVIVVGYPAVGGNAFVMGTQTITYDCSTTNVASTATYNLSVVTPVCLMVFANMW